MLICEHCGQRLYRDHNGKAYCPDCLVYTVADNLLVLDVTAATAPGVRGAAAFLAERDRRPRPAA